MKNLVKIWIILIVTMLMTTFPSTKTTNKFMQSSSWSSMVLEFLSNWVEHARNINFSARTISDHCFDSPHLSVFLQSTVTSSCQPALLFQWARWIKSFNGAVFFYCGIQVIKEFPFAKNDLIMYFDIYSIIILALIQAHSSYVGNQKSPSCRDLSDRKFGRLNYKAL